MDAKAQTITLDLIGCARCGEDHKEITYTRLTRPLEIGSTLVFSHWAPCPVNGEPVMLSIVHMKDRPHVYLPTPEGCATPGCKRSEADHEGWTEWA